MKIYLAGPMRGYPNFNFPAFHAAQSLLESAGHEVFSPAKADEARHGDDFAAVNPEGSVEKATENGFSLGVALSTDLTYICLQAEAIALLPGWEKSNGAQAEWATAKAMGLKFIYL